MNSKSNSPDLVQAGVLAPYLRVLRHGGAAVEHIFKSCHIPTAAIGDPEVWLPKSQVYSLAAKAARQTGTPELGSLVGRKLQFAELGRFGTAVVQSATLKEAGKMARRTIGSVASGADCWVEHKGADAWFCYQPAHRYTTGAKQAEQFDLAMLLKFVRLVAGSDWGPAKIRSVFDHGGTLGRVDDFSQADITRGGKVSAIGFPVDLLGRPIPRTTETVGPGPLTIAPPMDGSVSNAVTWTLESLNPYPPLPTLHTMAEMLQVHPRRLQRMLKNECTSYSELVARVRFRVACRLLETSDLSVKEIAHRLGYSGTNNFTRAFQRLAGMSPNAFRLREDRG